LGTGEVVLEDDVMAETTADRIIRLTNSAKSSRGSWETCWQEVADFVHPNRSFTTTWAPGAKRNLKILEGTAKKSKNICSAELYSNMTSPVMPWFTLRTVNPELMNVDNVKNWLGLVTELMMQAYQRSNFYQCMSQFNDDIVTWGIADLYQEENVGQGTLVFRVDSPAQCFYFENAQGIIDMKFRKFKLQARQVLQKWPEGKISKAIQDAARDKPDKEFEFIHAIYPRDETAFEKKDNKNFPIASVVVNVADRDVVEETGYQEFPDSIARWNPRSGDVYGDSPSLDALGFIKGANQMKYSLLRQAEKAVDPPLDVPSTYKGRVGDYPGALNYRAKGEEAIKPINMSGNLAIGYQSLQDERREIEAMYFVDIFLMMATMDRKTRTAYEVAQMVGEKMLILGPILGRYTHECLGQTIHRTFGIMSRGGYLPPPPMELMGQQYDVEYVSPLMKAQKAAQGQSITAALSFIGPLAQAQPEILDNIDGDEMVRYGFTELYGVPSRVLRDKKAVAMIRGQRAQQAQQQQQQQEALVIAKGMKDSGLNAMELMQQGQMVQ
jgi:hypothetical protein